MSTKVHEKVQQFLTTYFKGDVVKIEDYCSRYVGTYESLEDFIYDKISILACGEVPEGVMKWIDIESWGTHLREVRVIESIEHTDEYSRNKLYVFWVNISALEYR